MSKADPEKFDRRRGRHKKATSVETRLWNAEHLPPKPKRPSWMDEETEKRLRELRREIDPWS